VKMKRPAKRHLITTVEHTLTDCQPNKINIWTAKAATTCSRLGIDTTEDLCTDNRTMRWLGGMNKNDGGCLRDPLSPRKQAFVDTAAI
jgi:hypothetical protein